MAKRTAPPRKAPDLMEMTKLIAQLGGYIDRKNSRTTRSTIDVARPSSDAHHGQLLEQLRPRIDVKMCRTTRVGDERILDCRSPRTRDSGALLGSPADLAAY